MSCLAELGCWEDETAGSCEGTYLSVGICHCDLNHDAREPSTVWCSGTKMEKNNTKSGCRTVAVAKGECAAKPAPRWKCHDVSHEPFFCLD